LTWRDSSPHGASGNDVQELRQVSRLTPQQVVVSGASAARGPARLTPVAPDALQLRGVRGMARRDGVLAVQDLRRSRAQVNFSVGQYQDYD